MSKRIYKPHDIRWPGEKGLPRSFEDINANFDALFRALELAGISPSGVISPPGPTGGGGTGTPAGLSDPVTESHGGTGKTTYNKGDLLVGKADHKLDRFGIGAAGEVLTVVGGTPDWVAPAHEVLSATHTDTEAATVVRGDIITGQGATPKWKRLAKGALNYVLRMGANEPEWADPAHNVLSATHGDATAASPTRGDLITAQGAAPNTKWARFAKAVIGKTLRMGADEPEWSDADVPNHNDLGSIQGGNATERYHLTAAELATVGVVIAHALNAHTEAVAEVDFNMQQAKDLVIQTVLNVEQVNAYEDPTVGQILFTTTERAAYLCVGA